MKANAAAFTLILTMLLTTALVPGGLAADRAPKLEATPASPPAGSEAAPQAARVPQATAPLAANGTGPFGQPADFDSGWVNVGAGVDEVFQHNLGGDPSDYLLDLSARPAGLITQSPISQTSIGGDHYWDDGALVTTGYFWHSLNDTDVSVYRFAGDELNVTLRLRIWVAADSDYDSGWRDAEPGTGLTLDHNLGGDVDDYFVDLQFLDIEDYGINIRHYGLDDFLWEETDPVWVTLGAAWQNLTGTSIQVWRGADDTDADQVRVRIWRVPRADYDSGWLEVDPGTYELLHHNLGGPWNDLAVDVQFWDEDSLGRHQVYYGGNRLRDDPQADRHLEVGGGLAWLLGSTATLDRGADDGVMDKVRLRIWSDPRPKYDSGWTPIDLGASKIFDHNLGSNAEDYYVDLQFQDTDDDGDGGHGVNHWDYGGDTWQDAGGTTRREGAYWRDLTGSQITVTRMSGAKKADWVRVRIWIAPPADYDAWRTIQPGVEEVFEHNLWGNPDDYVVDLQALGPQGDRNARYYGTNVESPDRVEGFAWFALEGGVIWVSSGAQSGIDQVRLRIWVNAYPDMDTGWMELVPAQVKEIDYALGGDPDLYVVSMYFDDPDELGWNQKSYGGDGVDGVWFDGAFWYNLNEDHIWLWREQDDRMADAARTRIWFTGGCYELDTEAQPAEGGVIVRDKEPNCGPAYRQGTWVELDAVPNQGYKFFHWSGANWASYDNPLSHMVEDDQQIVAHYVAEDTCFTVTTEVDPAGSGTVTIEPAPNCATGPGYEPGTLLTVTAYADQGYEFSRWDGGYWWSDNNPLSHIVDGDQRIVAHFAAEGACYTLTTAVDPADSGEITAYPLPNCNGSEGYLPGTAVALSAQANEGYAFERWSGGATGDNNPVIVTMDGDRQVTAHFAADQVCYPLATLAGPPGSGTVKRTPGPNCGTEYLAGTVVTLRAEPEKGYAFDYWNGDATGTDNPAQVTMDRDRSVVANFVALPRKVLFDETHGERNTIDWNRALELQNTLPWHPEPEWQYYGALKDDLADEFPLEGLWQGPITPELLANYGVLMLAAPEMALDAGEQRAVEQFLRGGGGLILLGDCGLSPGDNGVWWANYDLAFSPYCALEPIPELNGDIQIADYADHPAVPWYATLVMNWGQSLQTKGQVVEVAWTGTGSWLDTNGNDEYDDQDDVGPFPVVAIYDDGCGRVAAVADNPFQDDGYEDLGNGVLMRSLLRWATGGEACEVAHKVYLPLAIR